jgi:hypothetical protein
MKSATIEDLAYYIQEAHKKNKPKPIIFLGAGASVTGGIPLAKEKKTNIRNILTKCWQEEIKL